MWGDSEIIDEVLLQEEFDNRMEDKAASIFEEFEDGEISAGVARRKLMKYRRRLMEEGF